MRSAIIAGLLLSLWFVGYACAGPSDSELLVVLDAITAPSSQNKEKRVTLFRSEVVTVIARRNLQVLIRASDDRDTTWLSQKKLASVSSFSPVTTWGGERQFEVFSGSGDSGQTYYLKADGTFRATFWDGTRPKDRNGRLYRRGHIIWARLNDRSQRFDQWNVLRLKENNKLCFLSFDAEDGCQCIGMENVFMACAK